MADIDHLWGNDINLSPAGDIAVTDGTNLGVERIIRRLMTRGDNAAGVNEMGYTGEYIWHPSYGASLTQRVGGALNIPLIKSKIQSQIKKESAVAKLPLPVITITPFLNGASVSIVYTDASTSQQQTLSFNVNQTVSSQSTALTTEGGAELMTESGLIITL